MVAWGARRAPALIVFEGVGTADAASVALLAHVARRLDAAPVLLVATFRPAGRGADLEPVLRELERHVEVRTLVLGGLPADAIARIARAAAPELGGEEVARVVASAEGNPLLAREVARAAAAGVEAHESVRATVRPALAALPAPARELVEVTAAAARPLELAEAAQLVGADVLADALDAACATELIDPAGGRQVRFAHSLVREACYAEIAPARRARLHDRLASTLRARPGAEPAEVARHRLLAGEPGPARDDLVLAAERARAAGALEDASAYLREAAALGGPREATAEVWMALADAEAHLGRRDRMEEAFREALARLGDDPLALASAHAARGRWLRTTVCAPGAARAAYAEAERIIVERGVEAPELGALVAAGAAWAEAMAGEPARAEILATSAERVPEARDDVALRAEIALARAGARARGGALADAERAYEEAAALAVTAERPDLAHVALANAASAAACRGGFARALELAERARGVVGAGPALETFSAAARAYALSRLGRHADALAEVEAEARLAVQSGDSAIEATASLDQGAIALAAGRMAQAATHLAAALAVEAGGLPRPHARLLHAEALVTIDAAAAEAELRLVPFEPVGPADLPSTLVPRLARVQGLIAAVRGDTGLALRRLDEAERGWRGHVGSATGDAFAATLVDLGRPPVGGLVEPALELGRVLADRATLLTGAGRLDEARVAAAEALDLADRVDSDSYRKRLAAFAPTGAGTTTHERTVT